MACGLVAAKGRVPDRTPGRAFVYLLIAVQPPDAVECPEGGIPLMALDLVTGGAGFIGSHLVDRLLAQGRTVRVLDNFEIGRRGNLQQHDGNPRLDIVEADVADGAAVAAAMEGVERVFHLAARADIVPSIQQPEA